MATARTFKLSKDINLNVSNKNINTIKGYPRAPDLESNVKKREMSENLIIFKQIFFNPLEGSKETCF